MGYVFRNRQLLTIALTHRSKTKDNHKSYERLEFLGDSILELIISEYLYKKYPKKSEGELTLLRSIIVNKDSLYEVGSSFNLKQHCIVDRSLNLNNSSTLKTLISSMIESIIGAVYLDRGLNAAISLVHKWIIKTVKEEDYISKFNYKGQLFEICQKNGKNLPQFKTEKISGPDHARTYTVSVYLAKEKLGTGKGSTKRSAEERSAKEALIKLSANLNNSQANDKSRLSI